MLRRLKSSANQTAFGGNPNIETRNPKQGSNYQKEEMIKTGTSFRIFRSLRLFGDCFEFRASDFEFPRPRRGYGPRSYTSTKPMPVPLFSPARITVYSPGGRVAAIADSRLFVGARPAALINAACTGLSCQSLLEMSNVPSASRNSNAGLASTALAGKKFGDRLGPISRATTSLLPLPSLNRKPAITTSLPVLTKARVLRFDSFDAADTLRS